MTLCDSELYQEGGPISPWLGNGVTKTYGALLRDFSFSGLMRVCEKNLSPGQSLHLMFGATTPLPSKSEVVTLGDNEEMEAWMLDTVSINPL